MTPAAVAGAVAMLNDPEGTARIQGDITLIEGMQTSSFRTATHYVVGDLPLWLWPQRWLANRPERAVALVIGCAGLVSLPLFWMVRRRAAVRLRSRTPKQ